MVEQICRIVGAGPAGLMLGLLLARAGVVVTVLEKRSDFLRDFRGDTVHPSTLEGIHELGLLDGLLKLPQTQTPRLHAEIGGRGHHHRRLLAPADQVPLHRLHAAM